jgi:hypothetical protein
LPTVHLSLERANHYRRICILNQLFKVVYEFERRNCEYTATCTFSDRPSHYCRSEKTCDGHATRYRRRPNRVSDVARLKLPLAVCTPVAALNNAVEECLFRKCQPCELLFFHLVALCDEVQHRCGIEYRRERIKIKGRRAGR